MALLLLWCSPGSATKAWAGPESHDAPVAAYRIDLSDWQDGRDLADLDLDLVEMRPLSHAVALGWPGTLVKLQESGLRFSRLTKDLGKDLAQREAKTPDLPCAGFGHGFMAGFWTYDEVMALLDSLAAHDVHHILTACDTLGYSVEQRPLVAIGVFNQKQAAGTRPEILLTSLTHAREPMSMQSVLYFLEHLVKNYGTDPDVTYLVDHREIWFVPVVNPDGYVRNENTWKQTGGFGFWRKNLRDNDGDGAVTMSDGVDLNRNFGFQWGFDDSGSSPEWGSQVYRGSGPFSEPETRALRDFCKHHAFVTADNVHAYYEATFYPWGHAPQGTPDAAGYVRLVDQVTRRNGYAYGFSDQLLYPVNGDVDDWLYGDQVSKPKCYSMTSEIGSLRDGFWPPSSRIRPLAASNLDSFMTLAYGAGALLRAGNPRVISPEGALVPGCSAGLAVQLQNVGLGKISGSKLSVRATSLDPRVAVSQAPLRVDVLEPGETLWPAETWELDVAPEVEPGTQVELRLTFEDTNGYCGCDTVALSIGSPTQAFFDDGSQGLLHWFPGGLWGQENVDGNPAFSDSPGGDYPNETDASLTLASGLDLSRASRAVLTFRTQWNIESNFDFGLVEVSPDSGATWLPLAGRWTRPGRGSFRPYDGSTQPEGVSGYAGNRRLWATEAMDISAYCGNRDLRLRFRLTSDGAMAQEGWLIDDIGVAVYGGGAVDPGEMRPASEISVASSRPPAPDARASKRPINVGVH